mmetsp:Transcript_37869/g.86312  ORF Transcript_37869/g.86312 Transcript_37869/m.86312 type:complete len:240 (-) Transcript_37869:51-770(-)
MGVEYPAKKLTMGYWAIRGLAAPMRMMAAYSGTEIEEMRYAATKKADDSGWETPAWFGEDKPVLAEKNAMINLPYMIDGDKVVTQSNSCFFFMQKKCGLEPKDDAAVCDNQQVMMQVFDLRNDAMKVVYGGTDKEGFKKGAPEYFKGVSGHYAKLNGFLRQKGTPFFGGAEPLSGDFFAFEMIDMHSAIAKKIGVADPLDSCAELKAFFAAFKALPKMQGYFESEAYTLTFNSDEAAFY